jgi:uncharacterized protein YndB with AHSA1/START domain/uncharacterized protein YciI
MTVTIRPAPVKKSVRVKAPPARAFDFFTGKMIRWWREGHHIGKSPMKDVVLEPKVGGRWYEVGTDGAVCEWGKVLAWDPPRRVVLAWQLTADWAYDANFVTELEVRFLPEGTGTLVELEHRNLDRFGAKAAEVRASLDAEGGWTAAMVAFAAELDKPAPAGPKAVVIGEPSGATMDVIMAVYPRHKAVADKYIQRGDVIGIGPFADRGNMAIFRTRAAAEQFAAEDPFILEGLVKSYVIRDWNDNLL